MRGSTNRENSEDGLRWKKCETLESAVSKIPKRYRASIHPRGLVNASNTRSKTGHIGFSSASPIHHRLNRRSSTPDLYRGNTPHLSQAHSFSKAGYPPRQFEMTQTQIRMGRLRVSQCPLSQSHNTSMSPSVAAAIKATLDRKRDGARQAERHSTRDMDGCIDHHRMESQVDYNTPGDASSGLLSSDISVCSSSSPSLSRQHEDRIRQLQRAGRAHSRDPIRVEPVSSSPTRILSLRSDPVHKQVSLAAAVESPPTFNRFREISPQNAGMLSNSTTEANETSTNGSVFIKSLETPETRKHVIRSTPDVGVDSVSTTDECKPGKLPLPVPANTISALLSCKPEECSSNSDILQSPQVVVCYDTSDRLQRVLHESDSTTLRCDERELSGCSKSAFYPLFPNLPYISSSRQPFSSEEDPCKVYKPQFSVVPAARIAVAGDQKRSSSCLSVIAFACMFTWGVISIANLLLEFEILDQFIA